MGELHRTWRTPEGIDRIEIDGAVWERLTPKGLCVCGAVVPVDLALDGNLFQVHIDARTGHRCAGLQMPRRPAALVGQLTACRSELDQLTILAKTASVRCAEAENRLAGHSMLAFPHLFLWHALFDGTRLCRCWHSQEMKGRAGI
jgi:hypothetical protein